MSRANSCSARWSSPSSSGTAAASRVSRNTGEEYSGAPPTVARSARHRHPHQRIHEQPRHSGIVPAVPDEGSVTESLGHGVATLKRALGPCATAERFCCGCYGQIPPAQRRKVALKHHRDEANYLGGAYPRIWIAQYGTVRSACWHRKAQYECRLPGSYCEVARRGQPTANAAEQTSNVAVSGCQPSIA